MTKIKLDEEKRVFINGHQVDGISDIHVHLDDTPIKKVHIEMYVDDIEICSEKEEKLEESVPYIPISTGLMYVHQGVFCDHSFYEPEVGFIDENELDFPLSHFNLDGTNKYNKALDIIEVRLIPEGMSREIALENWLYLDIIWRSNNWKPEIGEDYWLAEQSSVGTHKETWEDDIFDKEWYGMGRIFKTEEEAKSYSRKIKYLKDGHF